MPSNNIDEALLSDLQQFLKKELPEKTYYTPPPEQTVQIFRNHSVESGKHAKSGSSGIGWCVYDDNFEVIVSHKGVEQWMEEWLPHDDEPLSYHNRKSVFPEVVGLMHKQFWCHPYCPRRPHATGSTVRRPSCSPTTKRDWIHLVESQACGTLIGPYNNKY